MPITSWRQRTLAILIALVICLGLTVHGQARTDRSAATEPPGPRSQRSVPPTDIPTQEPTNNPRKFPPNSQPKCRPSSPPRSRRRQPTNTPEPSPNRGAGDANRERRATAGPATQPPPPSPRRSGEAEVTCRQPGTGRWHPFGHASHDGRYRRMDPAFECEVDIDASGMTRFRSAAHPLRPGGG